MPAAKITEDDREFEQLSLDVGLTPSNPESPGATSDYALAEHSYNTSLQEPIEEYPQKRLLEFGATVLSTAELGKRVFYPKPEKRTVIDDPTVSSGRPFSEFDVVQSGMFCDRTLRRQTSTAGDPGGDHWHRNGNPSPS